MAPGARVHSLTRSSFFRPFFHSHFSPGVAASILEERPTTPYSATMRNTFSITEPGGGKSGGDTVEIRVSGARLLEDSRIMEEKSVIVDMEKHEALDFDAGKQDEKWFRPPDDFKVVEDARPDATEQTE